MRIANLAENFSALSETFIYNYVVGLQKRGHESHVITIKRFLQDQRPYEPVSVLSRPPRWSARRIDIEISRRLGLTRSEDLLTDMLSKSTMQTLEQLQPDIIHAQFGPMGVRVAPIARELQIPLVVSFLGYDISMLPRNPYWQQKYKYLADNVDASIGVSRYLCTKLASLGFPPDRVHHIHLGADITKINYGDPAQRFDGKRVKCLHVGRLVPKKSPMKLVKAFALARKKLLPEIDLHLTIAGDGELHQVLMKEIQNQSVEKHVEVLGAVKNDQVLALLQKAHLYTQYFETAPDGDQEGQPVSLVEASASGLPVVATRHSGIPDVILDGRSGYLVEEGDIEGMADRISSLARTPELWTQFGRAGRHHIEANLTLDQQLDKTLALFERLLKSHSSLSRPQKLLQVE